MQLIHPASCCFTEILWYLYTSIFYLYRATAIHKAVGRYIAADLKPLSTVESKAFKQLIQELDGRYKLPGRTYFSNTVLPELYQETKQSVVECIQQAPVVALTTDGWTSRATQSYITITAHVIDAEWKMHNFVLQTRMIAESHTGMNIAEVLNAAIEEWGVQRDNQPIPIVTDNAANIGTAVQESKLLAPHVGCFAHVLNLACHSALKVNTVSRLLGRVRRIVTFFHRSSTAAALLVKKQKLLQLPEHKLIMDVATRWNSAYDMIERYLEQQAAVMAVLTQSDIRRNARDICTLSDDDITNLEELVTVLKPLSTVTALLCDAGRPTISLVLPLKDRLLSTLPPQAQDSALVSAVKLAIIGNLSGRYQAEDLQLYLWQASALDPRFKTLPTLTHDKRHMVYASLVTLASSDNNKIQQPSVTVKQEPGITAAAQAQPQPGTSGVENIQSLPTLPAMPLLQTKGDSSPPPKKKAAMEDIFGDIYVTKVEPATEVSIGIRAHEEVNKYTDHSQTAGIPLTEDPLLWWKSHQHEFPLLACVARRVLCVPGTSVPSERVFSTAGDVISAQRANLSPENADMLIFLKHNMCIWTLNSLMTNTISDC